MKPGLLEPNHRILVIDDNPAIHDDLRKILLGEGDASDDLREDEELLFGAEPVVTTRFEIDRPTRARRAWRNYRSR